jgi:hypothetical protein
LPSLRAIAIMTIRDAAVHVAITGTPSRPRHEVVALLESKTNASFSERVTYETNYLVAARLDTIKARRAAKLGVSLVSEQDMMNCIEQGYFEPMPVPVKPPSNWHRIDLDAIEYKTIELFPQPQTANTPLPAKLLMSPLATNLTWPTISQKSLAFSWSLVHSKKVDSGRVEGESVRIANANVGWRLAIRLRSPDFGDFCS